MAQKVRVFKLRSQTTDDLNKDLNKLKEELQQLRTNKVAGGTASKLGKIKLIRKRIAKFLTVLNEKGRAQVRADYGKKKALPLDMRGKRTRAIRRRLTKTQAAQKTHKQWKKLQSFPTRKFGLKA